jgi:hypothetical protein
VPDQLANVNGTLYFVATDDGHTRLWQSNGTTTGAAPILEFDLPARLPTIVEQLAILGNTFFFVNNDGANGYELWKSDGMASAQPGALFGTVPVRLAASPGVAGASAAGRTTPSSRG